MFFNETINKKFEDLLKFTLDSGENKSSCEKCRRPNRCSKRFIKLPKILAITVLWDLRDHRFCNVFTNSLHYNIKIPNFHNGQEDCTNYLLKGIVCFKINHYCCYFFNSILKIWYIFDDTYSRRLKNLMEVVKNMRSNGGVPVILFLEHVGEKELTFEDIESYVDELNCSNCQVL